MTILSSDYSNSLPGPVAWFRRVLSDGRADSETHIGRRQRLRARRRWRLARSPCLSHRGGRAFAQRRYHFPDRIGACVAFIRLRKTRETLAYAIGVAMPAGAGSGSGPALGPKHTFGAGPPSHLLHTPLFRPSMQTGTTLEAAGFRTTVTVAGSAAWSRRVFTGGRAQNNIECRRQTYRAARRLARLRDVAPKPWRRGLAPRDGTRGARSVRASEQR